MSVTVSGAGITAREGRAPRLHPALLRAYRLTSYEAGGVKVHIGRHSAAADHLLRAHGSRSAVFITAYNPWSRRMPAEWNQRMQTRLRHAVRHRPVVWGRSIAGHWSEVHLLVFGDPRPIYRLARHFRQHGIVIVRQGQPTRLIVVL